MVRFKSHIFLFVLLLPFFFFWIECVLVCYVATPSSNFYVVRVSRHFGFPEILMLGAPSQYHGSEGIPPCQELACPRALLFISLLLQTIAPFMSENSGFFHFVPFSVTVLGPAV